MSSNAAGRRDTLISADTATCADCLRELADPTDRRFNYPFINCTNCGPRFTIVRDVPYDRPLTTMAPFAMCPACAEEYHDPRDKDDGAVGSSRGRTRSAHLPLSTSMICCAAMAPSR